MNSTDVRLRAYLVARDEVDAADLRWWELWLPKAAALRALRGLYAVADLLIERVEKIMTDNTQLLHDVADGLRGLGPAITTLVQENARLAGENAALKGEDASESAAADDVKDAFDGVAHLFDQAPDVPSPEPLPDVPAPAPVPAFDQPADGGGDVPTDAA